MKEWKIYPLCLGRTDRKGPGVTPILSFYVTDGEHKVVVDTGGDPADGKRRMPYFQDEDDFLDKRLAKLGVACEDVDTVILTHLHWDHVYSNYLFPNAKFYVQRAEVHYAVDPVPIHAPGYELLRIFQTKYEYLDGDEQLFDGLSVLLTPSHTGGSQCVLVNTSAGVYSICGDFITQYDQWESTPRKAGNIHCDLYAYYQSFRKLEKNCDYILPGHDYRVLEHEVYPY